MSETLFDASPPAPKVDKKAARRAEKVCDECECWQDTDAYVGAVMAGDPFGAAPATGCVTVVCARPFHQGAAHAWAEASTGMPARFVPYVDGRLAL